MQQYLTTWDLVLTPFYLIILGYIARKHRDKFYPKGHELHPYYLPGLWVKFGGVIFIALIYQFYYGGGDTFNFFSHARIINSSLSDSFGTWFDLITHASPDDNPRIYPYVAEMYWYPDVPSYTVATITAVLGLFSFTSYIPIALLFAYLSYTGIWAMYKTFARFYPTMTKPLAIAFLFVPSTFVWGSSIFKDTVCMFALGWMVYSTFKLFVDRDFSGKNFFFLAISFYLIAMIKIYILLAFLPALFLWLLMNYSKKIRITGLRWGINLMFIGLASLGFLFFAQKFADELNEYSLENISKKAKKTQDWITYVSETQEGSMYDIGELDGTLGSMLSKFPQAVNVTLFRPYLWESGKPIILLSSLEATAFLILTFLVFYRVGIFTTFRKIFKDPNLLFFLIFTVIFAFSVGISTGNFGSLSRYKIPCMPFFAALLLILYYQTKPVPQQTLTHAKKPVHNFA